MAIQYLNYPCPYVPENISGIWVIYINKPKIDCLEQDCGISIVNALEIPQSCTKPSKYKIKKCEAMINAGVVFC